MEKCRNCKYLAVYSSGEEVCTNFSSENYDHYIKDIQQCSDDDNSPVVHTILEDDPVNHPTHYTNRQHECIDEMLTAFGKEAVIHFCICNAWKYRYRADSKGTHDQDMEKADWYINKAMELKGEITND